MKTLPIRTVPAPRPRDPARGNRHFVSAFFLETCTDGFNAILVRDVRFNDYLLPRIIIPTATPYAAFKAVAEQQYARELGIELVGLMHTGQNIRQSGTYDLHLGVYHRRTDERITNSYRSFDGRECAAEAWPIEDVPSKILDSYVMPAGQILHWFLSANHGPKAERFAPIRAAYEALRDRARANGLDWDPSLT